MRRHWIGRRASLVLASSNRSPWGLPALRLNASTQLDPLPLSLMEQWKQKASSFYKSSAAKATDKHIHDGDLAPQLRACIEEWLMIDSDKQETIDSLPIVFEVLDYAADQLVDPETLSDDGNIADMIARRWKESYKKGIGLPSPQAFLSKCDSWATKIHDFYPNSTRYTVIVEAINESKSVEREDAQFCESILDRIIHEAKSDPQVQPQSIHFAETMKAWIKSRSDDSIEKVENLFHRASRMEGEGWSQVRLNAVLCNIRLLAYTQAGRVDEAERIIFEMLESPSLFPVDVVSFSTLITAYSKVQHPQAPKRAEALLNEMQQRYEQGDKLMKPNLVAHTSVISAWARQANADRAMEILRLLEDYSKEDMELSPDVYVYNAVLLSLSKSGRIGDALSLLESMFQGDNVVMPNRWSFNTVMSAVASAGDAESAEEILTRMHELHQKHGMDTKPDVASYNTVIMGWLKSRDKMAWQRAVSILSHMDERVKAGDTDVTPNAVTYNTVIQCAAMARRLDKAEQVLHRFRTAYKENRVRESPNARTWNIVLAAYVRAGKSFKETERIFRLFRNGQYGDPDLITYNTLLGCLAQDKGSDSIEKAETMYNELQTKPAMRPNRISILSMLSVYISHGRVDLAQEFLLKLCYDFIEGAGSPRPDRQMFHAVISGFSSLQNPRQCERLVLKMIEFAQESGLHVFPTVATYNLLLKAWAESGKAEAGERAEAILRQMTSLDSSGDPQSTPDIVSYNTTLNAWANTDSPVAVSMIEKLVLEMIMKGDKDIVPDEVTYGTWLKAIERSTDESPGRRKRVEELTKTMKIHDFQETDYIRSKINQMTAV